MNDRIFVGGDGCPPLCQPIPGHCCGRQSGHFLEIGLLHLPLAALRRFPRRPARLQFHVARRGRCPHRPAGSGFVGADDSARPGPITQHLVGQGPCALPWVREKFGSGRRGRRPLRKRILWCVGEGLSCPPLCQPIPGHCRGRQSGHFLEIASLLPPPAALRRFPLRRGDRKGRPDGGVARGAAGS